MRKSIFDRLEQRFGNPVNEYIKISSFINDKFCCYSKTIFHCFYLLFPKCEALRKHYIDFEDCVNSNIGILCEYRSYIKNEVYDNLDKNLKDEILDEYLTYIEIIVCMFCVFDKYASFEWGPSSIDQYIMKQAIELVDESLKSINYKIETRSINNVKLVKIDPIAEYTAEQSEPSIRIAILNYLAARNNDLEAKESALHDLIDLLEPSFKKFKSVEIINKTREYAQIIRHPVVKKEQKEYEWFYKNKKDFLDDLFSLCVFTQQYAINREIINSFTLKKDR